MLCFPEKIDLCLLFKHLDLSFSSSLEILIDSFGCPQDCSMSSLVFVFNQKQVEQLSTHSFAWCLVDQTLRLPETLPENVQVVSHARLQLQRALAFVENKFYRPHEKTPTISPMAVIDPSAKIGEHVHIEPFVQVKETADLCYLRNKELLVALNAEPRASSSRPPQLPAA